MLSNRSFKSWQLMACLAHAIRPGSVIYASLSPRRPLPTPTPPGSTAFGSGVLPRLCDMAMRLTTRLQPGVRHTHRHRLVDHKLWLLEAPRTSPPLHKNAWTMVCLAALGGDGAQPPGCLEGTQPQSAVSTVRTQRPCQHRQCSGDTLLAEAGRPGKRLYVPPACLCGCH